MAAIKTQCQYHRLSVTPDEKEDIAYRSGSGIATDAWFFRNGCRGAINTNYSNCNWSVGFYNATNQAAASFMIDAEIPNTLDNRRVHTELGVAVRSQYSGAYQGINEIYNLTDSKSDAMEINSLELNGAGLDANQGVLVPFTQGVSDSAVGSFSVGTGASTVDVTLTFEPDLVIFTSAMRAVDPATDDAAPTANRYEDDTSWMFGAAHNDGSSTQRCLQFEEVRTQPTSTPSTPNIQIRNDAAIARATGGVSDFTGVVGGWNATGFQVTVGSGAAGEYILYHAMKFDDPSLVALVDTTIPASGDWVHTGLPFQPQLVINHSASNVTALNTLTEESLTASCIVFDPHNCWSNTIICTKSLLPTGGMSASGFYENINIPTKNDTDPVTTTTLVAGPAPSMTTDGWSSALTTHTETLGFSIAFGIIPSIKAAVGGYATV